VSRSLNKVQLLGNLGNDPEVRSTSSGTKVATLSVATSRTWNNQSGERQEKTEWHRVVLWNNSRGTGLADVAERYLKKGSSVYIEGSIEYRTWEDREGKTRYTTEIKGRELIMLSGSGGGAARPSADEPASGPPNADSYKDFPEALDEEDDDLPF
jgi:single-strand DNA-binding protein